MPRDPGTPPGMSLSMCLLNFNSFEAGNILTFGVLASCFEGKMYNCHPSDFSKNQGVYKYDPSFSFLMSVLVG